MEPRRYHKLLTALSLSRVILAVCALLIFRGDPISSAVVIALAIVAQVTDNLDGYIARKYSTPTLGGDIVDSVSDKAMQFALTIAVCREFQIGYTIAWIAFMREVSVLSIRTLSKSTDKIRLSPKWMSRLYAGDWRLFLLIMISTPIGVELGASFHFFIYTAQGIYILSFAFAMYSLGNELRKV